MENQAAALSNELLVKAFLHNPNRIYFAKKHIDIKMAHLIEMASFKKLQQGMEEFWTDVKKQINRMDNIFDIIYKQPNDESNNPFNSIIKDEFYLDERSDMALLKDMDILHFMQMLEHINITTYRLLKILAQALNWQKVEQLLIECFDESVDNDQLFVLITAEHIRL